MRGIDDGLQPRQMALPRQHLHKDAARPQHAGKFRPGRQGEHGQHAVEPAVRKRQMGRRGREPVGAAVARCGIAHGVAGDIDPPALRDPAELREIIPLPAPGVQYGLCLRAEAAHKVCQRFGDGRIPPRVQKRAPRSDHLPRVAGMARVLLRHRQKVYITLPCHIKAMPLHAAPCRTLRLERRPANGADHLNHGCFLSIFCRFSHILPRNTKVREGSA